GITYGIAAVAGFGFYIFSMIKGFLNKKIEDKGMLILLAWSVPYFIIVGFSFAKFNRYMLPFTPFLAIFAAKFIYDLYHVIRNKKIGMAIGALVVGGAMFYGAAFMNVYTNSHPWIQASRWIYQNVPEINAEKEPPRKTVILNEMWGDDLPVYADGKGSWVYTNLKWNLQEPDSPRKLDELSMKLEQSDYVMMADRRAYGTYLRIPERYPINYFYYRTMLNEPEKLGFKKAHEVSVYPSFLGITIKDDGADESWQLYDHPRVFIFKNEKYIPAAEMRTLLAAGQDMVRKAHGGAAAALPEKSLAPNPNMGKAKDRVTALLEPASVFIWYILVQLLAFAALPLGFIVFSNMKDRGYGLLKAVGIFMFAWINWMLVSSGAWKFYQVNLLITLAAACALAGFYIYKNRKKYSGYFRENHKQILRTETVFLGAYMFFIIIKLYFPNIHDVAGHGYNGGGEPMGMAYLSGIFNDVKFPPHDPWLSGFTLNYYYWGQLLLATMAKTLGYMPKIAYNLSLALLFALSFVTAYSLASNMTGKARYGLFAGFMLALAGNFHTFEFILEKLFNSANLQGALTRISSFQFIWDPTRIYPNPVITEMPFFSYLYGDLHAHNIVIPFMVVVMALLYNIIAAPNRTLNPVNSFGSGVSDKVVVFFMLALLAGSMAPMNTWNYPPALLFMTAVLFIAGFRLYAENYRPGKKAKFPEKAAAAALPLGLPFGLAAAAAGLSYVLFIFFHANFHSPYQAKPGMITPAERAPVYVMFKYFSVFFPFIFAYMFLAVKNGFEPYDKKAGITKAFKKFDVEKILRAVSRGFDRIMDDTPLAAKFIIFCSIVLSALLLSVFAQPSFGIVFAVIAASVWMAFRAKDRGEVFSLAALFLAACIIMGTEIIHIADGRMNTVFKFYMVVWVLLSISVPYLAFRFVEELKKLFKEGKRDWIYITASAIGSLAVFVLAYAADANFGGGYFKPLFVTAVIAVPAVFVFAASKVTRIIFQGFVIFIMCVAAVYPFAGAMIKKNICSLNNNKVTIDGTEYMRTMEQRRGIATDFDRHDYAAIEWINQNISRIEPILEAPGERMYTGVSRISIFTGMPTLVGWGYQVSQQSGRGRDVSERNSAARMIYSVLEGEALMNELSRLGIKYIY
ncbi:MAG TPA: hypothetical protein ENN43_02105, partial [bacterium]|nr:hypothetical protein [bacterium]